MAKGAGNVLEAMSLAADVQSATVSGTYVISNALAGIQANEGAANILEAGAKSSLVIGIVGNFADAAGEGGTTTQYGGAVVKSLFTIGTAVVADTLLGGPAGGLVGAGTGIGMYALGITPQQAGTAAGHFFDNALLDQQNR